MISVKGQSGEVAKHVCHLTPVLCRVLEVNIHSVQNEQLSSFPYWCSTSKIKHTMQDSTVRLAACVDTNAESSQTLNYSLMPEPPARAFWSISLGAVMSLLMLLLFPPAATNHSARFRPWKWSIIYRQCMQTVGRRVVCKYDAANCRKRKKKVRECRMTSARGLACDGLTVWRRAG